MKIEDKIIIPRMDSVEICKDLYGAANSPLQNQSMRMDVSIKDFIGLTNKPSLSKDAINEY
jgi:hypothetical protein